jgi:hypothetical protein
MSKKAELTENYPQPKNLSGNWTQPVISETTLFLLKKTFLTDSVYKQKLNRKVFFSKESN